MGLNIAANNISRHSSPEHPCPPAGWAPTFSALSATLVEHSEDFPSAAVTAALAAVSQPAAASVYEGLLAKERAAKGDAAAELEAVKAETSRLRGELADAREAAAELTRLEIQRVAEVADAAAAAAAEFSAAADKAEARVEVVAAEAEAEFAAANAEAAAGMSAEALAQLRSSAAEAVAEIRSSAAKTAESIRSSAVRAAGMARRAEDALAKARTKEAEEARR